MKFAIAGADREKGEDVELIVQAQNEDEARKKASRHGILVATCLPFERSSQMVKAGSDNSRSAVVEPGTEKQSDQVQNPKKRPKGSFWLRASKKVGIVVGLLVIVFFVVWLIWLKPQNEAITRTLQDAAAQYDHLEVMAYKSSERVRKRENAERLEKLRELSNPDRPDWYSNPPPSRTEAMVTDPLVNRVIDANPALYELILNNEQRWIATITSQMVTLEQITKDEAEFIHEFTSVVQEFEK